ncbi:hem peroxidase [Dillenia turbinata]|uniref:peroxidase n=1 Tax=Dillenia turbinata TaxID=194707 RepID=A0AAN8UL60_9MAGN
MLKFYAKSCPNAEKIVHDFVYKHIHKSSTLPAALIRPASYGNHAEKDAVVNKSLRGFDFINKVKSLLEAECPGIVSCADILALAARDSIGGPFWNVPTGRRDGLISRVSEASTDTPVSNSNFSALITSFSSKGLDLRDLVVSSGGDKDPSLDTKYAAYLKSKKCKSPNETAIQIVMDPGSSKTFDLSYYKLVLSGRGLFQSDAALLTNSTSKALINQIIQGSIEDYFAEFANFMEKMGRIGVMTGSSGAIRKHCALVNG